MKYQTKFEEQKRRGNQYDIEKDQKSKKKTFVKNKFECRWGLVVDVAKKEKKTEKDFRML